MAGQAALTVLTTPCGVVSSLMIPITDRYNDRDPGKWSNSRVHGHKYLNPDQDEYVQCLLDQM